MSFYLMLRQSIAFRASQLNRRCLSNSVRRLGLLNLLLIVTVFLFASTPAAQSDQNTKRATAEKLIQEAGELIKEGSKESLQLAIQKFSEAQPLLHSLNDSVSEAVTYLAIGTLYRRLNENQKAIDYYSKALPLARTIGDRDGEALILHSIGVASDLLGQKQKALDYYNQALPLRRASGDRSGEATTLNNIGRVHSTLGDKQKALNYYNQALPIFRSLGEREGEARTLGNVGSAYDALGDKQKALDYFTQALSLFRAVEDRYGEATMLGDIGRIHGDLGDKQKAIDYLNQALPVIRAAGDAAEEARTLSNIGMVYDELNQEEKALDYFNQALRLIRIAGDRSGEASILANIGGSYSDLGRNMKAFDYFTQALPLFDAVGDRSGKALMFNNIGMILSMGGEKKLALEFYMLSLPLRRAVGDLSGEGRTLTNIGAIYYELNEKQKALEYQTQALSIFRTIKDRSSEAVALNNIGVINIDSGEKEKALEYYNQALSLKRAIRDRSGEVTVLGNIASAELQLARLDEALLHVEASIAILESLRTGIKNQELRSSFFATAQNSYELYVDVLMHMARQHPNAGYDGKALQTSERARGRSLLELLVETGANIREGVDPKLLERERFLQQQINAHARQQTQILNRIHTEAQATAIAETLENLITEFQQVGTEIRKNSPRYAALTQPQPLSLAEIQTQILDPDTLLLEYSLGKDRSYLWAVTSTSITSYELPDHAHIEASARQVYDLLNARNVRLKGETPAQRLARVAQADRDLPSAAARLSQIVLAPAAAQLGKKRLVIVADAILQYIPFGALPTPSTKAGADASQFLIETHEIVSVPSASSLAVLRRDIAGRKQPPKTVVALADPVFMIDDQRVKKDPNKSREAATEPATLESSNPPMQTAMRAEPLRELQLLEVNEDSIVSRPFPRLPGSRKEANEIVAMVPSTQQRLALDFEASLEIAMSVDLSDYRYVHFSTHGFLNSVHPELSGIVFSLVNERGEAQDGFLRAHEVFNLKLPAELVVLSACQTGLGKEVRGEGLVSLTRGFMYAGARRVVVSLWSVSEWGTTELMVRFYRGMLKEGLRPVAALRAAQISLLKEKRWSAPFYWAPFILQGEWR